MNPTLSSASRDPAPIAQVPVTQALSSHRIGSIDALRGLVMLLMLVDHTREFFYFHAQVSDPMDLATTPPELFFTRFTAHFCAPVFLLLTGLAAYLYGAAKGGAGAASAFLFKRGLFLIALELTVVSFAWSFDPTPGLIYLQVIWAIGVAMIALSGLLHLPRWGLIALGLAIVLGHNLLDGIEAPAGSAWHVPWAILHDRGFIDLPWGAQARTSYPVLPWIGVIMLGYAIGPWFARAVTPAVRGRRLVGVGVAALALFALLRATNVYGDPTPWVSGQDALSTAMSVLNLTKYPPSANFLLVTLGLGLPLLAGFERWGGGLGKGLAVFGGVPLFFYVVHLYVLHGLNRAIGLIVPHDAPLVSVGNVASLWLIAAAVAVPGWFACRAFTQVKRRSGQAWMRYL
jgi:uncharacterized membrane protein